MFLKDLYMDKSLIRVGLLSYRSLFDSFNWLPVSTIGSTPEAVLGKQFDRIKSSLLDPVTNDDAPLPMRDKEGQETSGESHENEAPLEPIEVSSIYSREY